MYFLGVAFPFYGSINSLMGAISAPTTAFMLPAITYNLVYRSQAARDAAVLPPPKALQVKAVCAVLLFRDPTRGLATGSTSTGVQLSVTNQLTQGSSDPGWAELGDKQQCINKAGPAVLPLMP